MQRGILLAGVVTAAMVTALVLRTRVSQHPNAAAAAAATLAEEPVPTGRPVAVADPQDALAAAEGVIARTGEIATAGFITRGDLIRSLATERFGPKLAAESSAQLSDMTSVLGAASVDVTSIVWVEYPLSGRLVSSTSDEAIVEIWSVLVVAVPGVGAPRQVWRTVTMTMRWEREAWRVDAWSTVAGPTPALATTSPIATSDAVATVASWPRAGGES